MELWMAFVYPGGLLCLIGAWMITVSFTRRRNAGRSTQGEGVAAKPRSPVEGPAWAGATKKETDYLLWGGILLGLGIVLLAALGIVSAME